MSCECRDELNLLQDLQAGDVVSSSTDLCISSSWRLRIQYSRARMKDKVEATSIGAHLLFKAVRVPQAQVGSACRQQTTVGDIALVDSPDKGGAAEMGTTHNYCWGHRQNGVACGNLQPQRR